MLHLLTRLSGLFPQRRTKRKSRAERERTRALFPALEVRMLEERRVFHAGAIAAPVAGTNQPPPPPPATIVTLDASQNLLVQDASAGGQNDQLTIRLDAAHGRFEIFDPNNLLQTDIAGATGSGTSRVYIPVESIGGSKVIVNTLGGNDSLTVDLAEGLAGKTLFYDGGEGEQDGLTLVGGSYEAVGYAFQGDGTTQIQVGTGPGTSLLQVTGVEPIHDTLAVQARQFSLGDGLSGTLSDDGAASNDQLQLMTALGTIVTFVSPSDALTIQAVDGSGGTVLSLEGLDAQFAADMRLDAGAHGHVEVSGEIDLRGGDLTIRGETIYVAGRVATHSATIELEAESSLTINAEGVFENHTGQVLLDAGGSGTLKFSGRIDVSGHGASESGGTVHLLGRQVEMLGQASIDASGWSGGGEVLVGGDYQGLNPLVHRATNTFMSAEASIHANALVSGNGGKIIVWADEAAIVAGSGNLEARGGPQGGNGGLIETSGKRYLYVDGAPNAAGPAGQAGTWLLDPRNVIINHSSAGTPAAEYVANSDNTVIGDSTIVDAMEDNDTNVVIYTGTSGGQAGNITVNSDVEISISVGATETRTLSLNAANDIVIESGAVIEATSGQLNVELHANTGVIAGKNNDSDVTAGNVSVEGTITTLGGSFKSSGVQFENAGAIDTGGGNLTINHTGAVTISANISLSAGSAVIDGSSITFDAGTLRAGSADIEASVGSVDFAGGIVRGNNISISGDTITRAALATTEIVNTSTTGGLITLTATNGIGAQVTAPIRVSTGSTGLVRATTAAGPISLTSSGNLRIGAISSGEVGATISVTSSDNVQIVELSNTDDVWDLFANKNLEVVGGAGIVASEFTSLFAGLDIIGGTGVDFDQTAPSTDLSITAGGDIGTPDNPLVVDLDATSLLDLASGGNLCVLIAQGDLTDDRFALQTVSAPSSDVTICLGTMNGSVALSELPFLTSTFMDNTLHLEAHGAGTGAGNVDVQIDLNSDFVNDPLLFAGVTLIADNLITGLLMGAVAIDTTTRPGPDGNIRLESGGEIGNPFQPLLIEAGEGLVSARTTSSQGVIYLQSSGDMWIGSIVSSAADPAPGFGAVGLLSTSGSILGGIGSSRHIDTTAQDGSIILIAQNLGSVANPLFLDPGDGSLFLDSANDAFLATTHGDFHSNQFAHLIIGGDEFEFDVQNGSLLAEGDTPIDLSSVDGAIRLSALNNVGASAADPLIVRASLATLEVTADTGDIYVESPAKLVVGDAAANGTGKQVWFKTTNPAMLIPPPALEVSVDSLADDHWHLVSAGDLTLRVADNSTGIQFSRLAELSATGAQRAVRIEATNGPIDVDTIHADFNTGDDFLTLVSGADENISYQAAGTGLQAARITFLAGGSIGSLSEPLLVNVSDSVSATATTGDIYIESIGPLNVTAAAANGSTKDVSFATTAPGSALQVTTAGLDDDDWHLNATGDVTFQVGGSAGISFDQIQGLESTAVGATIIVNALGGPLTVDVLHSGVDTRDDSLTLSANGSITSLTGVVIEADFLILNAQVGNIGTPTTPFKFKSPDLISLSLSGGSQWLDAATPTSVGLAWTGVFLPLPPPFFVPATGSITLSEGTFFLDPILSPPFPVVFTNQLIVSEGAFLGGTGEVFANVLVQSPSRTSAGGIIDMGFAPGTTTGTSTTAGDTGRLIVNGSLTFQPGATLVADINPPYSLPGADYDQVVVTGALTINDSTLTLRGADQLRVTLNPIVLIDVLSTSVRPAGTGFLPDGKSLVQDGAFIRANLGFFRGKLLFNGGDGNDVVLSELSLAPPIQNPNLVLPKLRVPIFTTTERPIPLVQTPPPAIPPTIQPFVEPEVKEASPRMIHVRIVIPVDDAGNVREEKVMELSADWLEHLPMILRRLPDDHYRIYLVLDSGSEERLVIDVFVKGGQPVEPSDVQGEQLAQPMAPPEIHEEGAQAEAAMSPGNRAPLPALPDSPASLLPTPSRAEFSGDTFGGYDPHRRLLVGAAAAMTVVAASRRKLRWSDQVDQAAAAIGNGPPQSASWGWWRWGARSGRSQR